ncbi:hypothetical protein [Wolbachia endosymbiont of Tetranychus urticae]|uniref:hypothetical protein n=1 Tax=Wolbachia endosymbiont of Tetranychus urticae TaxID=169184 RepID=UPI00397DDC35
MPFIPLYFIYSSITSFPLLSICSLHSGNWYNNLAQRVYKTEFEIVEDFEIVPSTEKMYKTRAELISEGYEIIPFGNSFEKDAGHVFIKGKENNNSLPWYSSEPEF